MPRSSFPKLPKLPRLPPALRRFLALVVTIVVMIWTFYAENCRGGSRSTRLLTFNIENFPRSSQQVSGAFDAIAKSGAAVVAVQEITDPDVFAKEAKARLGDSWRFVAADAQSADEVQARAEIRVGLLYNSDQLVLISKKTRRESVVYDGARPALEVRLHPIGFGDTMRLLVVHLKAGGDGAERRRQQLDALEPVLREMRESGDRVVALGDFNAATDGDRVELDSFARETGMTWSSREVPCTAYWSRRDGCLGSALDQVLTSVPATVSALGPCATEGCELRPACPVFREQVSDHCPVAVDLR